MGRIHQQGDTVPQGITWWYILHNGHFIKKVDLSLERVFPKLDNPNYVYTCAG